MHAAGGAARLLRQHAGGVRQGLGATVHGDRHRGALCVRRPWASGRLLKYARDLPAGSCTASCAAAGTGLAEDITHHKARAPPPLQELAQQRGRFGPAQQPRIAALHQFAKDQRLRRKRGPSAMERRRDTTSFEAAWREWGGRTVSARGTVMTGAPHVDRRSSHTTASFAANGCTTDNCAPANIPLASREAPHSWWQQVHSDVCATIVQATTRRRHGSGDGLWAWVAGGVAFAPHPCISGAAACRT